MQETNPTATASLPWEDEDNPVPKRTKCIKCKINPRRSETSDYCLECWQAKEKERKARANGKGEKCKDCGTKPAGVPGNIASPYCLTCIGNHQNLTPQAKIDADRKEMSAKGELCTRCKHASPEPDEALCFKCKNHENKRKIKPGLKGMPESCMYGWMGDFCRKLNCPLDAAYPTALAIGAGYGVPFTSTVRTNLYTTLIGSKGTGKSVTIKRILGAWSPPAEIQVINKYPGSEIGLIQLLGGKKHKDMDEQDFVPKPYLLVQDEMRATLGKINIQNSALPYMFNQLFYQNDYGTASKQGHYECAVKLSMVGGLTCEDADEFASVYGVETTTGMYDRMVFGVCPEEWDFSHDSWQPPTEANGEAIRRRPKAVRFPVERFNQIKAWREMDYKARRRLGSHWTVRIDAHYIGGGRHYRTWEVADIGLMAIFRRGGKIQRSKLTFLQSKKLYASPLKLQEFDPYHRMGMGRLLVTEEEHDELVQPKLLSYSETSRYRALQLGSEQQGAMQAFSERFGVGIHYLLYNPSVIPWQIKTPVEQVPSIPENNVGIRVIPKRLVDNMTGKKEGYSPSYADVGNAFANEFARSSDTAGWRIEGFVCDHFITGEEGLVDDSPNFQTMIRLLSQKSSPISSALSITFDYEE